MRNSASTNSNYFRLRRQPVLAYGAAFTHFLRVRISPNFYCIHTCVVWHNTFASPKSSSRQMRRNTREAARTEFREVVMKWRCYLLSLLRIHDSDCEICVAHERHGIEIRQRLEELNWRTLPRSPDNGGHRIDDVGYKSRKAQASPAVSTKQPKAKGRRKTA